MNTKQIRSLCMGLVIGFWLVLALTAWFKPSDDRSLSERRPLTQLPELQSETILNGSFMKDFESYTLDQFPLRDGFRTVKSLVHLYGLGQKDNNDIYLADGYAAKLEYPLDTDSVDYAANRFSYLYDKLLKPAGCKAYLTVVPDKGYYLAEENGYPVMDYSGMFAQMQSQMSWAEYVDITDCLELEDYYRTDTHWRQENLLEAAGKIAEAMGNEKPMAEEYSLCTLSQPFYGVYYGQAALPMDPETLCYLDNEQLSACRVYDYESGKYGSVYDMSKADGDDLYEFFLSGSRSLLTIENPNGDSDRELIIFRDSFGSSIAPLLLGDYGKVTLVDIRYIQVDVLDRFLTFDGQDVLFLYSTLVLNNSSTIK